MQTSEVLNRAADLIEERGWTRGSWGGGSGRALCLEGGIIAALGSQFDDPSFNYDKFSACPAYVAVENYLVSAGRLADDDSLWAWNDDMPDMEPVIAVLRAAALVEETKEADAIIAAASSIPVREVVA